MKIPHNDEYIDRANAAYQREYALWSWRRVIRKGNYRFELVRDSGPDEAIILLTKLECADRDTAEMWLDTYRGRAAMRAALEVL